MLVLRFEWIKTKKGLVVAVAASAVILLVGGIALAVSLSETKKVVVSEEFRVARYNAGIMSRQVAELSSTDRGKIKQANDAENAKNSVLAESLLNAAQFANNEAARNAAELSRHLQVLISSVDGMPAGSSQRYAYAAMTAEISLVSEFIVYTKNLNEAIEAIAGGIEIGRHDQKMIDVALEKANTNVKRINELNQEFQTKISKFDMSVQ